MKNFVLLAGLLLAAPAFAQQMFRCGSVFQDRPCDAGVPEQRLSGGGRAKADPGAANAPTAATTSSPYAAQCTRVGEHVQRIMWKREGGATQEKQISEAGNDQGMVNLIMNVYSKRGTAPQVRAAVEAECVSERERQAAAADMLNTLRKQAGSQPMGPSGTPAAAPAPAAQPVATSSPAPARPVRDEGLCQSLKSQRSDVESLLRAGGSAVTMERLQNDRRDVERRMSEARC